MVLAPRPVPTPLHGITLRRELGDGSQVGWWLTRISRPIRRAAGVCEICGGDGSDSPEVWRLCCDEVWDYSEGDELVEQVYNYGLPYEPYEEPTARLVDFQAVCWRCNFVIHTGLLLSQYRHLKDEVFAHGARVNEITVQEFDEEVHRVAQHHAAQSYIRWKITWEGWEQLLQDKLAKLRLHSEMVRF